MGSTASLSFSNQNEIKLFSPSDNLIIRFFLELRDDFGIPKSSNKSDRGESILGFSEGGVGVIVRERVRVLVRGARFQYQRWSEREGMGRWPGQTQGVSILYSSYR